MTTDHTFQRCITYAAFSLYYSSEAREKLHF